MKNILVPTDFSQNAKDALIYAANFLAGKDAKLHVLSVVSLPPRSVGTTGSLMLRIEEKAQKDMEDLIESMKQINVTIEPLIREGGTVSVIMDVVEEIGADMVIMGTKGSTGLESVVLGSVASKVIERCPIPVISVPQGCKFNGLGRVLYPTDFQKSTSVSLKVLLEITESYSSKVDVLHIYPKGTEAPYSDLEQLESEVEEEMKTRKILFHAHPNDSIADALVAFIDAAEVEMLSMVTRRRGLIERLFDRSLTKRIAKSSKIPLLSFHA